MESDKSLSGWVYHKAPPGVTSIGITLESRGGIMLCMREGA